MENQDVTDKIKHILVEISRTKYTEKEFVELLENATFHFEEHRNHHVFPEAYNLVLKIAPDIFIKNNSLIKVYGDMIKQLIMDSSPLIIDRIKLLPDYGKLEIIDTKVFVVQIPWQEINTLQQTMLSNLRRSHSSIDFQAIGLAYRTIMDKLARQVFDPAKHIPKDENIKTPNGKFKNQLHTYIDAELVGEDKSEFRNLANSAINFVEDSIDFMNTTTHQLDAQKHLAEVCVVSTVSAISIIKLVYNLTSNR